MTRNQLEYLKILESQRANKAREAEDVRSHQAQEAFNLSSLSEIQRNNLERERQGRSQLAETARANQAREALNFQQHLETVRSNTARENETQRHNLESERISFSQLAETSRANRAQESIARERNAETKRSNLEKESQGRQSLAETERYNTAQISARQSELAEKQRAAKADEAIKIARNVTEAGRLAETVRSDLAREAETSKHNRAMELKDYSTRVNYSGGTVNSTVGGTTVNSPSTGASPITGHPITQVPKSTTQNVPKLTGRTVEPARGTGIIGSITNAFTGRRVQYVTEKYSDGSVKYYQEVLDNGKVTERQQISSSEFSRKAKGR